MTQWLNHSIPLLPKDRVRLKRKLVVLLLWAVAGSAVPTLPAIPQAGGSEDEQREIARRGMHLLMDGDPDGAIELFRQIEKNDPESPLGYLLEADANWWKIYLTRGNLTDPDVFEALSEAITPYDPEFQRLDHLAIQKAEAGRRARRDQARNYLYESLGYALQARLDALRDHALPTARAGKKMRNLSLTALKLDSNLSDAYLPVGLYNYFVATLPTYVKMLKFLIALPGGNRELGLRQLRLAAEKGEFTSGEAQFHLAKDLSRRNEQQYARSLELFREMAQEYPHNPLWKLLLGGLEVRLGHTEQGEDLYREVINTTAGLKSDAWQPLHEQAQKALARRH